MARMNTFLQMRFIPRNYDVGLLILRVVFGLTLCIAHGWAKIARCSQRAPHVPDPFHTGSRSILLFAILSDVVCSLLVAVGLATRWAALIIAINTGAAFALVHHFALFGPRSGEMALLFFGWALTIFITGPGRYSIDQG